MKTIKRPKNWVKADAVRVRRVGGKTVVEIRRKKKRNPTRKRLFEFWTDGGDQNSIRASSIEQAARIAAKRIPRRAWEDGAYGGVRDPETGESIRLKDPYQNSGRRRQQRSKGRITNLAGFVDAQGEFHPIRGTKGYSGKKAGDPQTKRKATRRRTTNKKGRR